MLMAWAAARAATAPTSSASSASASGWAGGRLRSSASSRAQKAIAAVPTTTWPAASTRHEDAEHIEATKLVTDPSVGLQAANLQDQPRRHRQRMPLRPPPSARPAYLHSVVAGGPSSRLPHFHLCRRPGPQLGTADQHRC